MIAGPLLIIRDMMLLGYRSFKQFLNSHERIATNILADRPQTAENYGLFIPHSDPADGRKQIYSLSQKGLDLARFSPKWLLWAAAHEDTGNQALVRLIRKDKQHFLAGVRELWSAAEK